MKSVLCQGWAHIVCHDSRDFHPDCECHCHQLDWDHIGAFGDDWPALPHQHLDDILSAYPALTMTEIARLFGISLDGVKRALKRHHVPTIDAKHYRGDRTAMVPR